MDFTLTMRATGDAEADAAFEERAMRHAHKAREIHTIGLDVYERFVLPSKDEKDENIAYFYRKKAEELARELAAARVDALKEELAAARAACREHEMAVSVEQKLAEAAESKAASRAEEAKRLAASLEVLHGMALKLQQQHSDGNGGGGCFGSAAKGRRGEEMLTDMLSAMYSDSLIERRGSSRKESDIHMTLKDGSVVVFEAKACKRISSEDVDKAYRDFEHLQTTYGDRLLAYIFVSMETRNIPKKGDFEFDTDRTAPIVFIGSSGDHAGLVLPFAIRSAVKSCLTLRRLRDRQDATEDDNATRLRELAERFKASTIAKIRKATRNLARIQELERATRGSLETIQELRDDFKAFLKECEAELEVACDSSAPSSGSGSGDDDTTE